MRPGEGPDSSCRAAIAYANVSGDVTSKRFSIATFSDALEALHSDGHADCLSDIVLYGQVVDPKLQQQVIEKLELQVPELFAIARDSRRGTYEDPQLQPLHRVFDEIVLETAYIKELNVQLMAIGKQVTSASHEKLKFRQTDGGLVVHFHLVLGVENQ